MLYQAFTTSPLKKVSELNDITQGKYLFSLIVFLNSLLLYIYAAILFLADSSKSGNITGVPLDINAGMEGRLLNTINSHDFA
jgi:hypothetical protein